MPKLNPGDYAPNLTLSTSIGSELTLSDRWEKGFLLLTFYRGDFCPFCNLFLHNLQLNIERFHALGTEIIAISSDRSELEKKTIEQNQLSFPVLTDPNRLAIKAYDVIYNRQRGHAEPATFLIGTDGKILYESYNSGPIGRPPVEDLLKIVEIAHARKKVI